AFNVTRGGHEQGTSNDYETFADAFMQAYEIAIQAERRLHYAGARTWLTTNNFCTAPYNALIVNPRGELVTCYEITSDAHPLAEISRIGHIENGQIFLDETARQHLHSLIAARKQSCEDCFCYWSCAGDCYTRTFTNQPDSHLIHGLRCQMNRTITRGMLLTHIAHADGIWHRWPVTHKQETQTAGVTI
ncbi:MAG: SPASM domain-containing protein, partial [Chloroflexi bacterium]